jgi:hypothetical protein
MEKLSFFSFSFCFLKMEDLTEYWNRKSNQANGRNHNKEMANKFEDLLVFDKMDLVHESVIYSLLHHSFMQPKPKIIIHSFIVHHEIKIAIFLLHLDCV